MLLFSNDSMLERVNDMPIMAKVNGALASGLAPKHGSSVFGVKLQRHIVHWPSDAHIEQLEGVLPMGEGGGPG